MSIVPFTARPVLLLFEYSRAKLLLMTINVEMPIMIQKIDLAN